MQDSPLNEQRFAEKGVRAFGPTYIVSLGQHDDDMNVEYDSGMGQQADPPANFKWPGGKRLATVPTAKYVF